MKMRINEVIDDPYLLGEGYIYRDGYVFTTGDINPERFNRLVIRFPKRARGDEHRLGFSERTLEEHINLVNEYRIENVLIVCDNLDFILECPCIKDITVYPSYGAPEHFDYSVLYKMPNLRAVSCRTKHEESSAMRATIDYSKIAGLEEIEIIGDGHVGYQNIPTLKSIWISRNKKITSFSDVSRSPVLKEATLIECSIKNLEGLSNCPELRSLTLWYNRSLRDISCIAEAAESLKDLVIDVCPRISDFEALRHLKHLKSLCLSGGNTLANLDFVSSMSELLLIDLQMKVADGNLTNCLNVPYAGCRNYKHYNLKDKDLPKHVEMYHAYQDSKNME